MKCGTDDTRQCPDRVLRTSLWLIQAVLAVFFVLVGYAKLTTPIPELASALHWAGDVPPWLVRFTALVDMTGGVGVLLPAATRILPVLTVLAAAGLTLLQVLAIAFHAWRGELGQIAVNVDLLVMSLFILWGRGRAHPVLPRA